jgi:MFS family permease
VVEHYRWPATVFGDIFSFESLLAILVQSVLLAWLAKRLSQTALLRASYVLLGLGLLLTPFAPALPLLFLFSAFYAVGFGLANPTLNSASSTITPSERQGELFGLLQGARSVGFLIGPILGGALFDRWAPAPYVLAGAVGLIASMLVPRSKQQNV